MRRYTTLALLLILAVYPSICNAMHRTAQVSTVGMYTVQDIGPYVVGAEDAKPSLNDYGQVVYMRDDGIRSAYLWQNGESIALPLPGMPGRGLSYAGGINNRGEIIGNDMTSTIIWYTYPYLRAKRIPSVPLDTYTHGISDDRVVVGGYIDALIWANGKLVRLDNGKAVAVSPKGQVTGCSEDYGCFIWTKGRIDKLETDGTLESDGTIGKVEDINNRGQVVGHSGFNACTWVDTKCVMLEGTEAAAYGVNDMGQIVGENMEHASIWVNCRPYQLDNYVVVPSGKEAVGLVTAYDINNRGQILCAGAIRPCDYGYHLILLTPVRNSIR